MKIPDDIYFRILDIATNLVNSSESLDMRSNKSQYEELRELCEAETASGRAHPFLFETLADFTGNHQIAISLYRKGLEISSGPEASAYRASIQLAMAERFKDMGEAQLAYNYAQRANEEAKTLDDLELRKEIGEFRKRSSNRILSLRAVS